MNIKLRLETPTDYKAVEDLTREAFWGFTSPICDEHYLVHVLRSASAFVQKLDYVAELDGKIVANVMFSEASVVDNSGTKYTVLTFGPLSVLPQYSHAGIGTKLLNHSLKEAKHLGYNGVVIHGHPDYYPRFGFQNAQAFGITNQEGKNYDALMAMELREDGLKGIAGKFYEDSVFNINEDDAKRYDANFPKKSPATLTPIDVLLERLPEKARESIVSHEITTLPWLNRISGREMLTWDGIDESVIGIINQVLREHNISLKLLPNDEILTRAAKGYESCFLNN